MNFQLPLLIIENINLKNGNGNRNVSLDNFNTQIEPIQHKGINNFYITNGPKSYLKKKNMNKKENNDNGNGNTINIICFLNIIIIRFKKIRNEFKFANIFRIKL